MGKLPYIIFAVIVIAGIYFLFLAPLQTCQSAPAKEINIGGHSGIALHIHPVLSIRLESEGKKIVIPTNVGVGSNIMRPIHTHDDTGTLHVESPCNREFKLGEFFGVWGQTFNRTCIFQYCNNGSNNVHLIVNGKESNEFENLILRDNDQIEIVYK